MSANEVKESLVAQVPLFAALPRSEIAHLAGHLRLVDYPAATLLLREGEPGDRMFILLEGEVEIIKALGSDDERVIDVRAAGDYFGEMSLLETAGKRMAGARTRTWLRTSQEDVSSLASFAQTTLLRAGWLPDYLPRKRLPCQRPTSACSYPVPPHSRPCCLPFSS